MGNDTLIRARWIVSGLVTSALAMTPASAGAAGIGTLVDLGNNVVPAGAPAVVSGQDEVPVQDGIWVNGTVETPTAPAAHPGDAFTPQAISSSGVAVGFARTTMGEYVPAYWDSAHSPSFVEVPLSGLSVNGSPAAYGRLAGVDSTGEAVGYVQNAAGATAADFAGLFVAGSGGLPAGTPQVVTSLGGGAVHSLGEISAGWEAGANTGGTYFAYNRQTGVTTTSGLTGVEGGPGGFADNGLLAGVNTTSSAPEAFNPSGAYTTLQVPSGDGGGLYGINASGVVVGEIRSNTDSVGETWSASGVATALLSEVSANPPGFTALYPSGIDDTGDIDGTGEVNGQSDGFLVRVKQIIPPVVTSTGDAGAADPSSGSCDTGRTVADATGAQVPECTLRAAIQAVNSGNATTTNITFDVPAAALGPVKLGSALPAITAPDATVDGSSESAGKVEVLGPGAATGIPSGSVGCLDVQAEQVTISGLYVGGCQVGIELEAPGHDLVSGDVLGLATDGVSRLSNNYGVWASDSPDDAIGGASAADRDVISDNIRGVVLQGPRSSGDLVQGDLIGTDTSGSGFAPDQYGVTVFDADRDTVGSAAVSTGAAGSPPGNVIVAAPGTLKSSSANFAVGVLGVSNPAVDDMVAGNLIGTDASGSELSPAGGAAVNVALAGSASSDQVENNGIAGATAAQVLVDSVDASQDTVSGNLIGSNHAGTDELASSQASGIVVAGANGAQITANAITGQGVGVRIQALASAFPAGLTGGSAGSSGSGKTQAVLTKNVIGPLGDSATVPKQAQDVGILDNAGQQDRIGPGNVVSFDELGVLLGRTKDAELYGNKIGTDPAGTAAYPDGLGVVVAHGTGTRLGRSGQPNTISGNTASGIDILGSTSTEIRSELIGTTFLGNVAIKGYRGTLPWGDLVHTNEQLPGSLGAVAVDGVTGIVVYGGSEKTSIGSRGGSVVIAGIKGTNAAALELRAKAVVDNTRIGVGRNGKTALANSGDGVEVRGDDADGVAIIDSIVAHNKTGFVIADSAKRTLIRFNSIFDNGDGIVDHTKDAPVAPDLGDPHLTTYSHRSVIFLTFTVHLTSLDRGEVDFYATPGCEKGGAGKKEIGTEKVDGGVKDKGKFLLDHLPVGTGITATVTTKPRGTSEFSKCEELKPKPRASS